MVRVPPSAFVNMAEIEEEINQYKRYLEKYLTRDPNVDKILKVFRKLNKLGINFDRLQNTGIGKTVNSYRKHDGDMGERARDLVTKWKAMVSRDPSPVPPPGESSSTIQTETVSNETSSNDGMSGRHVPYMDDILAQKIKRSGEKKAEDMRREEKRREEKRREEKRKEDEKREERMKRDSRNHEKRAEKISTPRGIKEKREERDHKSHRSNHSSEKSRNIENGNSSSSSQHKDSRGNTDKDKRDKEKGRKELKEAQDKDRKERREGERKREKERKPPNSKEVKNHEPKIEMDVDISAEILALSKADITPMKEEEKEEVIEEVDDHDGLSFEDFLNYDASRTKSKKLKKTKVETSKVESKKSDTKSRHRGDHKHHKSKHSDSKPKKESSSEKKGLKRPAQNDIVAPPPPQKQVKLSTDDIIASISDISTNYKPMPQPKLLEETVQKLDESDAGTKKNTRTAVYSGRKTASYLTAVPTLYNSCLHVLKENIEALDFVGGVPYEILKPVLEICTPTQLYTLEDSNPQFVGETDELWTKHCNKDFRGSKPGEFESWRELYLKKHDEREHRLKNLTVSISKGITQTKDAAKKTKLAYVDVQAKAPRGVLRKQRQHGTSGPSQMDPLSKLSSHGGTSSTPRSSLLRGIGASASSGPSRQRGSQKVVKSMAPMMAKTMRSLKGMSYK